MSLEEEYIPSLEEADFDEDGLIATITDSETGQVFTNDKQEEPEPEKAPAAKTVKADKSAEEKTTPEKPGKARAGATTLPALVLDPDEENEEPEEEQEEEQEEQEEYVNDAHYILEQLGYDKGPIQLAEGVEKPLEELTETEQIFVITRSFDEMRQRYEAEIDRINAEFETNPSLIRDPDEALLVNLKRRGLTPRQMAEEIMRQDPLVNKTTEDLARLAIKAKFPGESDEEVEAIFEFQKGKGKLEKLAEEYRASTKDADLKLIEEKQLAEQERVRQLEIDEDIKFGEALISHVKAQRVIDGIPLNEQMRNYVFKQALPLKSGELSPFDQKLSDPKQVAHIIFWSEFGPTLLKNTAKVNFDRGRQGAKAVLQKFSDKPIVTDTAPRRTVNSKAASMAAFDEEDNEPIGTII